MAQQESTPTPAILYAAKSTEDKKGSIPEQLKDGRAMADHEGWEIVGEYTDEAASAWSGDRGPGLAKAMEHAERLAREHGGASLVVQHSDRLARGDAIQARHLVEVVLWAIQSGVTIRSVQDDLFADERIALINGVMMGGRNTEDSARKSKDVRKAIEGMAQNGKPWGTPAYGYTRQKGEDGWEVEPTEEAIRARIYRELVDEGRSYSVIAKRFNAERVPTRKGGKWDATKVRRIVESRAALGEFCHLGEWYKGNHKATITEEEWAAAQALAKQRRQYAPKGRSGRLPKRHVFTHGMLRCGKCGEAFLPRTSKGGRDHYVCRTRRMLGGPEACSMPILDRATVDGLFLELFEETCIDLEATRKQVAEVMGTRLSEIEAQADRAEREVADLRTQAARIERDYRKGDLPARDWVRLSAEIATELAASEAEAQRLREHADAVRRTAGEIDGEAETLRALAELRALVAEQVTGSGGAEVVEPLRVAVASHFEAVYIHQTTGGFYLEPWVRQELIDALRPGDDFRQAVLGLNPEKKLSGTGLRE